MEITPCQYARERHRDIARWRNLWSLLVFAFGSAIILFSIVAVTLFVRQAWVTGAVSTVATVVSGVGISWVLDRRRESVAEEEEAYRDVMKHCGTTADADAYREKLTVLRRFR
jgi:hypothetical protein